MTFGKWNSGGSLIWADGDILLAANLNDSAGIPMVPIGGVVSWMKNMTGVPNLPSAWQECNGTAISDADSPLSGTTAKTPNLNGSCYFLMGSTVSEVMGGTNNHNHQWMQTPGGQFGTWFGAEDWDATSFDRAGTANQTPAITGSAYTSLVGTGSGLPPFYTTIYIMRIK